MKLLNLKQFGIIVESFLSKPVPYSDLFVQQVAGKALDKLRTAGLLPSGIVPNSGDHLFNYSLFFAVLNGKCSFRMTSDKIEIKCMDAIFPEEYSIFWQFVIDCVQIADLKKEDFTSFQMYAHVSFKSDTDRQEMLGRFGQVPEGVSVGGVIIYAQSKGWKHELRMQVDRSALVRDGLFILGGTRIEDLINRENLATLYQSFEELGVKMGFKVETFEKK